MKRSIEQEVDFVKKSESKLNNPQPTDPPLAFILDSIREAAYVLGADWNFYYVNQAAADFGGKTILEIQGKNLWKAFPDLLGSPLEDAYRRAMRDQVRINFEFYLAARDRWFDIRLHPSPQYLMVYAAESARRVQTESGAGRQGEIEGLNTRLQETNEALTLSTVRQHELTEQAELLNARLRRAMQESHHRIKNNLQVVSSLLEMRIGDTGETECDEHLKNLQKHIRALTNIHDLLTHQEKDSADADTLSTRAMLGWLIPMLQETSGGRHIKAEIADALFPMPKAVSLSLLVSECVSNAIKHSKGEIEIAFRVENGDACLEVCDDGAGFPPGFDWRKAANTGLSLIDATARHDLRGEVRYENHAGGGRVCITFPVPTLKLPLKE